MLPCHLAQKAPPPVHVDPRTAGWAVISVETKLRPSQLSLLLCNQINLHFSLHLAKFQQTTWVSSPQKNNGESGRNVKTFILTVKIKVFSMTDFYAYFFPLSSPGRGKIYAWQFHRVKFNRMPGGSWQRQTPLLFLLFGNGFALLATVLEIKPDGTS